MSQDSTIDRKAIARAKRAAREAEREAAEVLVGLMSRPTGRAWVWAKLDSAAVFTSTYNDNPQRMAFAEGQRAAGLSLLADLMRWTPDLFIQAMREANERRSERDSTDSDASDDSATGEFSGSPERGRVDEDESGSAAPADPGPTVDDDGAVRYQ